ncbi:hypothetical protein ACNKF0_19155 [Nocardioides sp. T5]|uniref:hypothetical protein n=1 Tax=Nocardioides sp. T5 TaxID=3400182 RepID=UPI003A880776
MDEQRLLNPGITSGYTARMDAILGTPGVEPLVVGACVDVDGQGWATPTVVATDLTTLREHRENLLDEAFGPHSFVVEYASEEELAPGAEDLFSAQGSRRVGTPPRVAPGRGWRQHPVVARWMPSDARRHESGCVQRVRGVASLAPGVPPLCNGRIATFARPSGASVH